MGGINTKLIERNTTIPTKKSQVFSTAADNQTAVSIVVLQGEREIASQNRVLGKFDLVGIPAAPRGVPQIEVTFDIDANGIVQVSAKDLGTGKKQEIKIESSSGLPKEEIEKMVKDAEAHAEEDKAQAEKVNARNTADNLIYATEKSLKEYGDKVSAEDKKTIEEKMEALKKILENQSASAEEIKKGSEELQTASYKLAEEIYKAAAAEQQKNASSTSENAGNNNADNGPKEAEDASYTVVDDEKK